MTNVDKTGSALYYNSLFNSVKELEREVQAMKKLPETPNFHTSMLSRDNKRNLDDKKVSKKLENGLIVAGRPEGGRMVDCEIVGVDSSASPSVKKMYSDMILNGSTSNDSSKILSKQDGQNALLAAFNREYDKADKVLAKNGSPRKPGDVFKKMNWDNLVRNVV